MLKFCQNVFNVVMAFQLHDKNMPIKQGIYDMPFSVSLIQQVWEKGKVVTGHDPEKIRKDSADAWIFRDKYSLETAGGWTIDHIYPLAKGGDNNLLNLRPLHWKNNQSKADDFPVYKTEASCKADGSIGNELKAQKFEITEDFQQKLRQLYRF